MSILHLNIEAPFTNFDSAYAMTKYIIKAGVSYFAFNPTLSVCENSHTFYGKYCPVCGKDVVVRKTKKGRKYFGCEGNPTCDFMSWQKPVDKKCPECGNYMVEKGNIITCSNVECGYKENK